MTIPKEVYRYVEYELYHYAEYKKELELERERILESSSMLSDGMPKGNETSDSTAKKAISLNESKSIKAMREVLDAIDVSLKMLSDGHRALFKEVYGKGRKDIYSVCAELGMSERTYRRHKAQIVLAVAGEMGKIQKMA